jgi:hypothetical protein
VYAAMWAVVAAAFWVCVVATPQPLHLERDSFRRPNVWQKRDQQSIGQNPATVDMTQHLPQLVAVNSQLMLRSPRGSRQYDVPQIGKLGMPSLSTPQISTTNQISSYHYPYTSSPIEQNTCSLYRINTKTNSIHRSIFKNSFYETCTRRIG